MSLPFPPWPPGHWCGLSLVCEGSCGNPRHSLPLPPPHASVAHVIGGGCMMTFCLPGHNLGLMREFPGLSCFSGKSQVGGRPRAFQHSQRFRRPLSACSASSVLSWTVIPRIKSGFLTMAHHSLTPARLSGPIPPHMTPHP